GREDREGDRKVEAGPFLAQRRRREVDRDACARPLELCSGDAGANASLRLLARTVGQADDREGGNPTLDVRFDLDPARIDADERVRDGACEHVATLGDGSRSACVDFVPIAPQIGLAALAAPVAANYGQQRSPAPRGKRT